MEALRAYLKSTIETIEFNLGQHDGTTPWPYPGNPDEARGKLQGYKEILRVVGG